MSTADFCNVQNWNNVLKTGDNGEIKLFHIVHHSQWHTR